MTKTIDTSKVVHAFKPQTILADLEAIDGLEYVYYPLQQDVGSDDDLVVGTEVFTNVTGWPTTTVTGAVPQGVWATPTWWTGTGTGGNNDVRANVPNDAEVNAFISLNNFGAAGGSLLINIQIDAATAAITTAQKLIGAGAWSASRPMWGVTIESTTKASLLVRDASNNALVSTLSGTMTDGTGLAGSNIRAITILIVVNPDTSIDTFVRGTGLSSADVSAAASVLPGVGTTDFDAIGLTIGAAAQVNGNSFKAILPNVAISDAWIIRYPGVDLSANIDSIATGFQQSRGYPPSNLAALITA